MPCVYESAKLTFNGVDGYDVYNPSIPFTWKGKSYIFGRVERRHEWARSWVRLFENTGKDDWTLVPGSMIYQLEDPYVTILGDTLVLGGTHVRFKQGHWDTFYGYFYRGTDLADLYYFATGPDFMKDIRLVELSDGRIGVFSRPRGKEIREKYGSDSMIGFTIINTLDDLTASVIQDAPYVPGLMGKDEWGACNHACLLDSGLIGIIGHIGYKEILPGGQESQVYMNNAFVFDPVKREVTGNKIIGTRRSYPEGPMKLPHLPDVVFSAGIVPRGDGKVDLYSGLGDTEVGRIVIDNPFAGYGSMKI